MIEGEENTGMVVNLSVVLVTVVIVDAALIVDMDVIAALAGAGVDRRMDTTNFTNIKYPIQNCSI